MNIPALYWIGFWLGVIVGAAVWTYQAAKTLKCDFANTPVAGAVGRINTSVQENPSALYSYNTFETTLAASGVTVPNLLKLLALAPIDSSHGADGLYTNSNGERCALRGGRWYNTSDAGVFSLYLSNVRSNVATSFGFRSAFIP